MVPTKLCATCGRPFAWRKAWARAWDEVRYCSKGCRSHRPNGVDLQLEEAIVELVAGRSGTVCPSEAARVVGGDQWRPLLERTRNAARRLQASGRVSITQGGRVVGPDFRGPIRIGATR